MIETVAHPRSSRRFIKQYAHDLGKGISKTEHMACEVLRMNSFKHRPYDSYKGAWPSDLAKAGLYYDPRSEDTICFSCAFRKPASFWLKGRNPFHFHRIDSPDCKYITGQCKENVPFHTREQIKNELSYLEPNSCGNRPASIPLSNRETASIIQESNSFIIQSRNRLREPPNIQLQLHHQRSDPPFQSLPVNVNQSPQPLQPMRSEEARLMTYTRWPSHASVSPEDLARAGFFYTGYNDRVQCTFCEGTVHNWESGDQPMLSHRRNFPRCRFVQRQDVGNIPIPHEERIKAKAKLVARSFPPDDNLDERQTTGPEFNLQPKHPEYASYHRRLETFKDWKPDHPINPQDVCNAGFSFTGDGDRVRCFYCDESFCNWGHGDDPCREHARWSPECSYITKILGNKKRHPRSLLHAFLTNPEVRILQRMGYKRRTLETVIRHQLIKTGRPFSSVVDMFESVVHYTDKGCCIDLSCCRRSPSPTHSPYSKDRKSPVREDVRPKSTSKSARKKREGRLKTSCKNNDNAGEITCEITAENNVNGNPDFHRGSKRDRDTNDTRGYGPCTKSTADGDARKLRAERCRARLIQQEEKEMQQVNWNYRQELDTNRLRSENSQRRQQEEQPLTPYMPFLSGLPDRTVINQMTIQYYITVPFQGGLQIPQLPVPAAEPGIQSLQSLGLHGYPTSPIQQQLPQAAGSTIIGQGDKKKVEDHKILLRAARVITNWEDLRTLGLDLGSDPDDIDELCTVTHSVKTAAYNILKSFYNQSEGPMNQTWKTIKAALESLGKNAAVRELELDRLCHEEDISNGSIPIDNQVGCSSPEQGQGGRTTPGSTTSPAPDTTDWWNGNGQHPHPAGEDCPRDANTRNPGDESSARQERCTTTSKEYCYT